MEQNRAYLSMCFFKYKARLNSTGCYEYVLKQTDSPQVSPLLVESKIFDRELVQFGWVTFRMDDKQIHPACLRRRSKTRGPMPGNGIQSRPTLAEKARKKSTHNKVRSLLKSNNNNVGTAFKVDTLHTLQLTQPNDLSFEFL